MTKEFEEKNYNWGKEFNEIWESSDLVSLKENLKNFVYRKVLEQTNLFISQHFLPKSKVREKVEGWCYRYDNYLDMMVTKKSFYKGLMARELKKDLLKDLDL